MITVLKGRQARAWVFMVLCTWFTISRRDKNSATRENLKPRSRPPSARLTDEKGLKSVMLCFV